MDRFDVNPDNNLQLLESICSNFEESLRQKQSVSIEETIKSLDTPLKELAFRALLAIEIEFHQDCGSVPSLDSYSQRFPDKAETVKNIYRETFKSKTIKRTKEPPTADLTEHADRDVTVASEDILAISGAPDDGTKEPKQPKIDANAPTVNKTDATISQFGPSATEMSLSFDAAETNDSTIIFDDGKTTATAGDSDKSLSPVYDDDKRYQIVSEIDRGGMGVILKVRDIHLQRTLAMKVIRGEEDLESRRKSPSNDKMARFVREATITSRLDHPGVVPVHEMAKDKDGRIFFTMKYVQGKTLGQVYREVRETQKGLADSRTSLNEGQDNEKTNKRVHHQWTQSRILEVLVKVCDTLAFAHSNDVIHRDLKPANIMLGEFGETYVMDWGLAKILSNASQPPSDTGKNEDDSNGSNDATRQGDGDHESQSDHQNERDHSERERLIGDSETMDGSVMGTPHYMPPEQALGQLSQLDQQTDIYSIGAMLYEALAGEKPYHEYRTTVDVIQEVCARAPIPISTHSSHAPVELVAIAEKAMQRKKSDRYANAVEMADDLRAFMNNRVVAAYRTGWRAEFEKWIVRNRTIVATALALLLIGLGVISVLQSLNRRALANENAKLEESQQQLKTSLNNEKDLVKVQKELTKEAYEAKNKAEKATENERRTSNRLFAQKLTSDADRVIKESGDTVLATLLVIKAIEKLNGDQSLEAKDLLRAAKTMLYKTAGKLSTRMILKTESPLKDAVVTPDGKKLVTVGTKGRGEVWDFASAKRLTFFFGRPKRSMTQVRISPDGKRILACGDEGMFGIWDLNSGRNITLTSLGSYTFTNNNFQAGIQNFDFLDDGKRLIVCSNAAELFLLDGVTGDLIDVFEKPEDSVQVSQFALSDDGEKVAVGTRLGQIYLWNVSDQKLVSSIADAHQNNGGKTIEITSLCFSGDSKRLVSTATIESKSENAKANLWDAETGSFQSFVEFDSNVTSARFRPKHRQIVLCTRDRLILWDTKASAIVNAVDLNSPSSQILFDSSGTRFAVSTNRGASFYEISSFPNRGEKMALLESVSIRGKSGLSVAFHPDHRQAVTFGANEVIHVVNLGGDRAVKKLARSSPFAPGVAYYMRVNAQKDRLFVPNSDLTAGLLYSLPDLNLLHTLDLGGVYNRAEFSPSKNELITGTKTGECRRWNVDSGQMLNRIGVANSVETISIDEAQQEAFLWSLKSTYRWDLETNKVIGEIPIAPRVFHRIPVDASFFISVDRDKNEIRSFDPVSGKDSDDTFKTYNFGRISPGNKFIWCHGEDESSGRQSFSRELHVLDAKTLKPIWSYRDEHEFKRPISGADFSADGKKCVIRHGLLAADPTKDYSYSIRSLSDFSEICSFGNSENLNAATRDFSRLLITESRGPTLLIDGTDGSIVRQLPPTFGYYRNSFFSSDGKYFISQSHPWERNPLTRLYPSRVSLWLSETGELLAEFPSETDLYVLPFLPNNEAFMTFSETGQIQSWPIDIFTWAKKHLPRELTLLERKEFLNVPISDQELTEKNNAITVDQTIAESQFVEIPDQESREFTWSLLTRLVGSLRKSPSAERLGTAIAAVEKFITGPYDTDPIVLDKAASLYELSGDIDRAIQLVEQAKQHSRGKKYTSKLNRLRSIIAPRIASFASVDWLFSDSIEPENFDAVLKWSKTESAAQQSSPYVGYIRARQKFAEMNYDGASKELERLIEEGCHFPEIYLLKSECHSLQKAFGESEKTLRMGLGHESCRSPELWNQWLAISFAKEKRSPQELLEQLPPKSKSPRAAPLHEDHVEWLLKTLSNKKPLRINSGWYRDETIENEFWKSDCFFTRGFGYFENEGRAIRYNGRIENTTKQLLYQTERFILNDFIDERPGYQIPLPVGEYSVTIGFAEIFSNERLFDVVVEGKKILSEYDPANGRDRIADEKTIDLSVADGILNIELIGSFRNANPAKISMLSIVPK